MTHITGIVKISRQAKGDEKTKKLLAENSEYAKLVDNKKRILNAYESERYVVMQWMNIIAYEGIRKNIPLIY